jgi:serine/threonine-protein kinase
MTQDEGRMEGTTLTTSGMMLGTPEYMAPEMARGEPIDARADIYELGIVLFQMLSGRVPFKGETPLAVVVKQVQEPLPSLHQINPAIPTAVDRVVQKATAKRREDRYRSAGELARALRLAISPPISHAGIVDEYAPTEKVSQPGMPPVSAPAQGMPSVGAGQAMNFAPWPEPERSRGAMPSRGPVTPEAFIAPATPYPTPVEMERPRSGLRLWSVLITVLLVVVLILGVAFVALQLRGTSLTPSPTTTTAPNPTSGSIATATPIPPTAATTSAPSTAQQAQTVVQQYYNDINNADYQSAYNLWGTRYQSTQSYNSFASGFANTVHDNVTFGDISPLPDGTVQVRITLQAVERTAAGNATSTFQGYYIVGQENGSWKLLSASFSKTG